MEEVQPSALFSLSIDPVTKAHLSETARWARFLAIVGMICLGLMVIFGLFYSIWLSRAMGTLYTPVGVESASGYNAAAATGSAAMFIIMAVVGFFPLLFIYRFAAQVKTALTGNDQESLNSSFQNLKRYFRYFGVITIIGMGLWLIWLLVLGAGILWFR
ncbi:MAG TPA: DUF5362 family protein [Flavisolibacter sp.]|jgi:hypothetical protein